MIDRREFVAGMAGAALGAAAPVVALAGLPLPQEGERHAVDSHAADKRAPEGREYYELRTYELRNDLDVGRARAFFAEHLVPALRRAGTGPVAAFTPDTGLPTPSFVLVVPYPSLADVGTVAERLAGDAAYATAAQTWTHGAGLPYVRYDVALYRAFAGHPRIEVPTARPAGQPARVYELRTYEAPNAAGLRAKMAMFNEEEIRIFRGCGFTPIFFGEAVAAPRLPHLTYAVAFDSMEARAAAWACFGANPDWQRIRVRPGWTDPETVSVIRSAFLRPTDFSDVR